MAYTLGDIITSVKTRAKDTSLADSFITELINATQTAILGHRRYSFMERNLESATLSTNRTEYELEDDVQVVHYLALRDTNGNETELTYIPPASWGDASPQTTDTAAKPTQFTIFGRTILFDRKSNASYRIIMRYLAAPTALSASTDIPSIPVAYREILVRGALSGVEEYRDNFDFAALHTRKMEELAEDMTNRYGLIRQTLSAERKTWSFRNGAE